MHDDMYRCLSSYARHAEEEDEGERDAMAALLTTAASKISDKPLTFEQLHEKTRAIRTMHTKAPAGDDVSARLQAELKDALK